MASDVLAGSLLGLAGLVLLRRHPRDPVAVLLVLGCVAWFLGAVVGALFLHRGVLLHAVVVAAVAGRFGRPWQLPVPLRALVLAGYLVSAVPLVARALLPTLLVGLLVASVVVVALRGATARARRSGLVWVVAGLLTWVAAGTVARDLPGAEVWRVPLYEAGIVLCAVATAVARSAPAVLGSATLQHIDSAVLSPGRALALALDDPDLRLGFLDGDVFRDADGSRVQSASGQVATDVDTGAAGPALIVHRPGLLDDRRVRTPVVGLVRLLAEHLLVQRELAVRTVEVQASQDRLRASEERASLEVAREIDRRVVSLLDGLRLSLQGLSGAEPRLLGLVEEVLEDLALSTRTLQSAPVDDLHDVLRRMAARSLLRVDLDLHPVDLSPETARALSFVASEALSNAAKHSGAARVDIRLRQPEPGEVVLSIRDTGRGGAACQPGGGLHGLDGRLSGIGGRLVVRSAVGLGTEVVATAPTTPPHSILVSGASRKGEKSPSGASPTGVITSEPSAPTDQVRSKA